MHIEVIGGGLAGCEAAFGAAERGASVTLYEMKPLRFSPAHKNENLCELVCSNSLKADRLDSAGGLLKAEMKLFGSITLEAAEKARVPAGGALAVDRDLFAEEITKRLSAHPRIEIVRREVIAIPRDAFVIVAPGPLADGALAEDIQSLTGDALSFFDAAAPIVYRDSIDMSCAFFGARYGRGDDDYINCPMTKEEYDAFYDALISAERAPVHGADVGAVFEGCMPIEVMASRGRETLLYGPLRPVGLRNPADDTRPYAVVQLRQDNKNGTLFNLVGFQTNLRWGEQQRVFSKIPALKNAVFARYGVMHRNSFIDSPRVLCGDFSLRAHQNLFFAGQITGVEGYMESAAAGILAGYNAVNRAMGRETIVLPPESMMGALARYISNDSAGSFQPMNANFGLLPPLPVRIRDKRARYEALALRSLDLLQKNILQKTNNLLLF